MYYRKAQLFVSGFISVVGNGHGDGVLDVLGRKIEHLGYNVQRAVQSGVSLRSLEGVDTEFYCTDGTQDTTSYMPAPPCFFFPIPLYITFVCR